MTGNLLTGHDAADLIRLDRYPVHAPGSKGYAALVTGCRREIDGIGCCTLPGFLTGGGLRAMREDSVRVAPFAHHSKQWTNVYFGVDDESRPERHPIRRFFDRTSAFVPADRFPETSVIRALYEWPGLMPFFQDCLGAPVLYRYADPLADVILNVLNPGEEFPWHFDTNEFSISIMTQKAEAGGLFEFCPNLRDPQDENYHGVGAVLDGDRGPVRKLDMAPGDLQIFKGRFSMHRVTRVTGAQSRYMAIYSYAGEPNMVGRVERTRQLYGKVLPVHMEAEARRRGDGLLD